MSEEKRPEQALASDLNTYRIALAALEAEKARLAAKYDTRIAELQKAIAELERQPAEPASEEPPQPPKSKREAPASQSSRARKGTRGRSREKPTGNT